MDLKSLKKIVNRAQYDAVSVRIEELINEATVKGLLASDANNEYTQEIGRLSLLGAQYEREFMKFKYIKVKSPLIKSIENAMYEKHLRQKDVAEILGVNEPTLSQIMNGKRHISMRMAKKLHEFLLIDPKLIIEYA